MAKLTAKQQRFIDEYMIDLNATQAAIRSGYSKKRAGEIGYQLLRKTTIQALIAEQKKQLRRQLQERFIFGAIEAQKAMYKILKDENASDRDKITVARDFLDWAGFKALDKVELAVATNPFAGLTTEELRRLAGIA